MELKLLDRHARASLLTASEASPLTASEASPLTTPYIMKTLLDVGANASLKAVADGKVHLCVALHFGHTVLLHRQPSTSRSAQGMTRLSTCRAAHSLSLSAIDGFCFSVVHL